MTLSTPGGIPASSAAWAMRKASRGVHGWGLSTTVQPAARAGATFTTLSMNGKLKGVMAPTTPTGSRNSADPVIPSGPAVGAPASTHSKTCSIWVALARNIPMEPPAWT